MMSGWAPRRRSVGRSRLQYGCRALPSPRPAARCSNGSAPNGSLAARLLGGLPLGRLVHNNCAALVVIVLRKLNLMEGGRRRATRRRSRRSKGCHVLVLEGRDDLHLHRGGRVRAAVVIFLDTGCRRSRGGDTAMHVQAHARVSAPKRARTTTRTQGTRLAGQQLAVRAAERQ